MESLLSRVNRINYYYLLITLTSLWILINLWYIVYNIYDLNNGGIVDTTTSLQSLLSAFYHEPFLNTVPGGSYFSTHASEILYVLLPFFIIYHNFIDLYIIQSILIYSASIPLFLLAKKKLNNEKAAFFISLVYLLNPYIHDNPFETLTLFMGFIIYSYYFFDSKKYVAFIITFLLSLSTMEFNPIMGGFFGLYLLLLFIYDKFDIRRIFDAGGIINRSKMRIKRITDSNNVLINDYLFFGIFILIVSISFFYMDKYIILYFSAGKHLISSNIAGANASSVSSLLKLFDVDISSKIDNLMYLNAPFLFLSFLDPFVILELPWFLTYSISNFSAYWSINVYYDSYIIPFAAIAAILGLKKIYDVLENNKKRDVIVNRITYLAVLITVILLISNVLVPMYLNPVTPVNSNDYGVDQLAPLIPGDAKVYTGVNELPIVSSQAANTWFYGPDNQYTLFNVTGAPGSLKYYNFVAASGSYALYEKNYTGKPDFNNLNLQCSSGPYYPGISLSKNITKSLVLPPGNYNFKLNFNYKGSDIVTYNKNGNKSLYLDDDYALVYPFNVNSTTELDELIVDARMTYGYYYLQSMITTSFDSNSVNPISVLSSVRYGQNQYDSNNIERFDYNGLQLNSGQTYYLWLWSSGYPGGMTYPVENTTHSTGYIATIYNGPGTDSYGYTITYLDNVKSTDLAPKFSFVLESQTIHKPSNVYVTMDNTSKEFSVSQASSYTFSASGNRPIIIHSNSLNGTLSMSYTFSSTSGQEKINALMTQPYLVLALILISSLLIYPVTAFVNNHSDIINLSAIKILLSIFLIVFYSLFTLYYYRLISMNLLDFKILGIIILALLFMFIIRFNKNKY